MIHDRFGHRVRLRRSVGGKAEPAPRVRVADPLAHGPLLEAAAERARRVNCVPPKTVDASGLWGYISGRGDRLCPREARMDPEKSGPRLPRRRPGVRKRKLRDCRL